jgi:hypothetical protein
MKYYQITNIEFDFDDEDLTDEEKDEIVSEATTCLWTSPTEEDLANTITDNMGWCIKSLEYTIK